VLDACYRQSRIRIIEIVRTLEDEALTTRAPGCPAWSVRELLAHLTGVAADVRAQRLDGDKRLKVALVPLHGAKATLAPSSRARATFSLF
jgi:hypothetical protein